MVKDNILRFPNYDAFSIIMFCRSNNEMEYCLKMLYLDFVLKNR